MAFALSLTALGVALSALVFLLPSHKHPALHKRVMVNTITDKAFDALLYETVGDFYVLKDVTLHESDTAVKLDGEIVLKDPEFIQVIS